MPESMADSVFGSARPGVMLPLAALLLGLVAAPVRRGRRVPALLALLYLVPLTILITLVIASGCAAILVFGLGIAGKPESGFLPWLLLLPLPIFIILLLKDLCSFLKWIAGQPAADKPPTPFLPPSLRSASGKK